MTKLSLVATRRAAKQPCKAVITGKWPCSARPAGRPPAGTRVGRVRVVVQRASSGSVEVAGEVVGSLPRPGLVVLVGVTHTDTAADADRLADKVWQLRILDGERSASDAGAPVLVISQFTLYADTRKGRRPSWSAAAPRPAS